MNDGEKIVEQKNAGLMQRIRKLKSIVFFIFRLRKLLIHQI